MAKKLSVFCALPPERNTGMATVDLAAVTSLQALIPDVRIDLYTYGSTGPYTYQPGELPYRHLNVTEHSQRFFDADAWLFWGDFIHTHAYFYKEHSLGGGQDSDASAETSARVNALQFTEYARYAFLAEATTEARKRAVVFGGTLITNQAEDALDTTYWQSYGRFFGEAGAVLFRDAISAAKIAPLRSAESTQGCDCAFLLSGADLAQLSGFKAAPERKGVGVFFGRSPHRLTMMRFAKRLAASLQQDMQWLPWFRTRRKIRMLAKLVGYSIPAGEFAPGDLLSRLSGYQYIVTDTYHICVNAWRMGIPAVCIGVGSGYADSSLGDKKKEVLYEMLGAQKFYVFTELLKSDFENQLRSVVAVLKQPAVIDAVCAQVDAQRNAARSRLKQALDKALA